MYNQWGTGNTKQCVYIVEDGRLGNNDHQPKKGSLAICLEHSGDYFYTYVPLVVTKKYMRADLAKRFGSYVFSKKAKIWLTDREFHLLMAGEKVGL